MKGIYIFYLILKPKISIFDLRMRSRFLIVISLVFIVESRVRYQMKENSILCSLILIYWMKNVFPGRGGRLPPPRYYGCDVISRLRMRNRWEWCFVDRSNSVSRRKSCDTWNEREFDALFDFKPQNINFWICAVVFYWHLWKMNVFHKE